MSSDNGAQPGSEGYGHSPPDQGHSEPYNPTLRSVPQSALGHMLVAKQLFKQGKFALVIEELDKVLVLNPELATGYLMRGVAALKLGRTEEARQSLETATQLQGDLLYAWMVLAHIQRDSGDLKQALYAATQATYADLQHGPAFLLKGSVLGMLQWRDDALAAFREAVRLDPNSTIARYKYAGALTEAGKVEEAEQQILTAYRLNPALARSRIALGDLYLGRKEYSRAIEEYKAAIEINLSKSALPQSKLGEAYYQAGQIPEAIRSLKTSLQHDPKQVHSYLLLGRIFQELGQLDDAAEQFGAAIAIDGNYPQSLELLAKCQELQREVNPHSRQALAE